MLEAVLAATSVSVPAWTWVFFAAVIVVLVVVVSVAMQRARGARGASGAGRAPRGLTPEQQAFQDEMRLMLEARLREQERRGEPPAE